MATSTIWPRPDRAWVDELPAQLGERKFRLLVSGCCRVLLEPGLEAQVSREPGDLVVQRRALAALDASDRFADTGKSKAALREAVKQLDGLGNATWPFPMARLLLVHLLTSEPTRTLYHFASSMLLSRMVPLEEFVLQLRDMVSDLVPPEALPPPDPGHRSPEVLDLAEAIYQSREFRRMPELGEALQHAGCRNQPVLDHCRTVHAQHLRGCWVLDWLLGDRITRSNGLWQPRSPAVPLKRHQLLRQDLRETPEETLRVLATGEAQCRRQMAPGQPHPQLARESLVSHMVIYAALEHLGYGPVPDLGSRLNEGVDLALDYFWGDGWRAGEAEARAKTRPDQELPWSSVLHNGLLLCGLTERWDAAAKICAWFEPGLTMEHRFELDDYEYQWLYLCLVSYLRTEPLEAWDVPGTLNAIRNSGMKRARLLAAVWEAVLNRDQGAFDHAMKESVQHFLKSAAEDVPNPAYWLAQVESIMGLIGEREGLRVPALPEKLDAAVIRRETLGAFAGAP